MKRSYFLKYVSIATIPLMISCAETDQDKIRDAQACLDKATAATASACMTKVNGLTSKASYLIRCSAMMIKQGLSDPTKLSSIMTAMSGGSNPTGNAMTAIMFSSNGGGTPNAADQTDATNASNYCYLSGSPGLNMLGFLANLATFTNIQTANGNAATMTAYAVSNAATLANTGSNAAMLAASYQQNCSGGSSAYSTFCTQYATAIANTSGGAANQAGVAQYYLAHLN